MGGTRAGPTFEPIEDPWASPGPADAERLVADLERRWGALVTVHDLVGVLALPDDTSVLADERLHHRHPTCLVGRPGDDEAELRCIEHCYKAVNLRAGDLERAFTHRCWRGQREIAVPVHHERIHCLTVFVNPFPRTTPGARESRRRWPAPERVRRVVDGSHMTGGRLIEIAEKVQGLAAKGDGDDDRRRVLRRLLAFSHHRPVGREAVAEALGVSESRASHVVKELFGRPWRELQVEAKLERAKRFLKQRTLSVTQVASLAGYDDPNTFIRIFRRRAGLSPDRWRRTRERGIVSR